MTGIGLLLGLALLVAGGELLVRGATGIARSAGVPPLVVGLTVVAFGTSAPELAVTLQASLTGRPDLAVGNVVGSNIFNILVILGLSSAIVPLTVKAQLVRFDVPILIGISILVQGLGWNGTIGRLEGAALFAGLVAYTVFLIRAGRRESADVREEFAREASNRGGAKHGGWRDGAAIVGGLVLLVGGSRILVTAAVEIARGLGISELIIGLTIVAAGTSLPEVAASVVAAVRGERDIAVGNAVGSCIFNLLSVLGLAALVSPAGIPVPAAARAFDIPVMVAVAVASLPILFTGMRIGRWEGLLFLAYYAAYTAYLILDAVRHDALQAFSRTMVWFVLPLTTLTMVIVVWREFRGHRVPKTERA